MIGTFGAMASIIGRRNHQFPVQNLVKLLYNSINEFIPYLYIVDIRKK